MDRIRVLIIDQNPRVRRALAIRLSVMPQIEVLDSVGSVNEAERVIRQTAPDVVLIEPKRLSDRGMPLIRALTSIPRPPLVIVLTSYRDEEEEFAANELGISCYMLKEIDSQALLDAILACHGSSDSSTVLS